MPYLWAAYRRGALPPLPEGFSQPEFDNAMLEVFKQVEEAYVLLAEIDGKGQIPVGVGVIKAEAGHAWPHIWWFPEATNRKKLELVSRFVVEMRKRYLLLIVCQHEDKPFFNRLSRLGLTRRVGTINGWNEDETVALYQSRIVT